MTDGATERVSDQRRDGRSAKSRFARATMLLALVMALALLPASIFGYWQHDRAGVAATCVAALVCFLSAFMALSFTQLVSGTSLAVAGILLSTVCRTLVPLGIGVLLFQAGGWLADANVFGMILVFYFVSLAAETVLAVRLVGTPGRVSRLV